MERRTYTVTGQKASPEEIDRLIETGESETIFAKAILEQGRGHVSCRPMIPHFTPGIPDCHLQQTNNPHCNVIITKGCPPVLLQGFNQVN